jgi:CBS domain containing-hemolysin-like protein
VTAFLIIAGLILLNGIFVAAEFAIVGAPRAAIDRKAQMGNRLARAVQRVLDDPRQQDRYIATAQLGITVASLGLGMYGEHVVADAIYQRLGGRSLPAWLASHGFASTLAVAILTYFHIVVGEMVPKSLALQRAEQMALWITPPMLWTRNALFPFVVSLNWLGNVVLKLFGVNRQVQTAEQYYTPEELQLVVQESEDLGAIRAESGQMLQELFEFGELTAAEAMVPRVRVVGIPLGTTPVQVRQLLGRTPHTRYPIYERDLDHIVGMVHIKDLLRVLLENESIRRADARPLPLVPETAPLDSVLSTMRQERTQMVIVLDEHGGTSGVVTLEARRTRRHVRRRDAGGSLRGGRRRDRGRTGDAAAGVPRRGESAPGPRHDAPRRARTAFRSRPGTRGCGQRQRADFDAPWASAGGWGHRSIRSASIRGHGGERPRR